MSGEMLLITVDERALDELIKRLKRTFSLLQDELNILYEQLKIYEKKYGIQTKDFLPMIKGNTEWRLPDGAELDAIEWEAITSKISIIMNEIKNIEYVINMLSEFKKSARRVRAWRGDWVNLNPF